MASNECTCSIVWNVDDGDYTQIEFCLMHEAAPELLEALEEIVNDLWYQIESKYGPKVASEYPSIVKAKSAIAKARGNQ